MGADAGNEIGSTLNMHGLFLWKAFHMSCQLISDISWIGHLFWTVLRAEEKGCWSPCICVLGTKIMMSLASIALQT